MQKKSFRQSVEFFLILIFSMLLAAVLAISSYAWLSKNRKVFSQDMGMQIKAPSQITIDSELTAVRSSLSGEVVTDTCYVESSGAIYLVDRESVNDNLYDKDGNKYTSRSSITYDLASQQAFEITSILPGEYIDITIGYSFPESLDGCNYAVYFEDIVSDTFQVQDPAADSITDAEAKKAYNYDHYAAGAFKYKPISLVNTSGTAIADYSKSSYKWMVYYDITKDDEQAASLPVIQGTWNKEDGEAYLTVRVYEDFSQYYDLLNQATEAYGNLLSTKTCKIGSIVFVWDGEKE